MKRVRCAIYTRKSSEEGLEQDFNSLHAQREACAAYVLSQASEGWTLNPDEYDDGGISGGTLERPALRRLLADIADGTIDIVVVYKVDRLTRSLLDFSKLVEAFDKARTSFVSITQSFNTTTSMGRLTLNMLLSFAQFEREVTAERIRDKIAASKAKGMWMGGIPPLGYAKNERSLQIVEDEAVLVRRIFARYLELGNVRSLAEELQSQGVTSRKRSYANGREIGGGWFGKGQLYHLLNNPIYIGRIRHRENTYPGLHPAIIDAATWEAVQARMADNTQGTERHRVGRPSLLAGLVRDAGGMPLIASHACKSGAEGGTTRYRYYVSRSLQEGSSDPSGTRVPARELENAVITRLAAALSDPLDLVPRLRTGMDEPRALIASAAALRSKVLAKDPLTVRPLIEAVHVLKTEVRIDLKAQNLAEALGLAVPAEAQPLSLTTPARLARTGMAVRMVMDDGRGISEPKANPAMVKLVIKGRSWWEQLASGTTNRKQLARQEGVEPSYVSRVVRLAFLSPRLVACILKGEHLARLDSGMLLAPGFPASWREQERVFLKNR